MSDYEVLLFNEKKNLELKNFFFVSVCRLPTLAASVFRVLNAGNKKKN
jgi:hypothetical protein